MCGMSMRLLVRSAALAGLLLLGLASPLAAGGGPERSLLIIDPSDPDSLRLGRIYAVARDIPSGRILTMRPGAQSFEQLHALQGQILEGELAARGIADQVDSLIIAPGRDFFVPIPAGIIASGCLQVSRLSLSSAYGFLPFAEEILAGGLHDQIRNQYYGGRFTSADREPAFDATLAWRDGMPAEGAGSQRYRIAFLLGYLGERGNTVAELERAIAGSAAADFSHPDGTFYFMDSPDDVRTRDRRRLWPATVDSIRALGGQAEVIQGRIPEGRHDALGILTGLTDPSLDQADLGILPGAFADHLTSFAGRFDSASQGKMSQWIAAGAAGSAGTVEEPCTGGKFPDPDLHARYLAGMSLGEALWRSTPWTAFQTLFYGDPLTRPFVHPPSVQLLGLPDGPVGGRLLLTAEAEAGEPERSVGRIEVLVDGRRRAITRSGALFELDTRGLSDGWHDLRLVAFEDHALQNQGRWVGEIEVDNMGRGVELTLDEDLLPTIAQLELRARGGPAFELRLWQDDRIVAAFPGARASISLTADLLGAGPQRLQAEALYADGSMARSRPVSFESPPGLGIDDGQAPPGFDHTLFVLPGSTVQVDLPVRSPLADGLAIRVLDEPSQAELIPAAGTWMLRVPEEARGLDRIRFQATREGEAWAAEGSSINKRRNRGRCCAAVSVRWEEAIAALLPTSSGPTRWMQRRPNCASYCLTSPEPSEVRLRYCAPGAADPQSLRLCQGGGRLWLPWLNRPVD